MITPEEFLAYRKKYIYDVIDGIAKQKQHDYSGTKGDMLKNIRAAESIGIPAQVAVIIRLQDKLNRLGNLLVMRWQTGEGPAVKNESIRDTTLDAIQYLSFVDALEAEETNGGKLPQ